MSLIMDVLNKTHRSLLQKAFQMQAGQAEVKERLSERQDPVLPRVQYASEPEILKDISSGPGTLQRLSTRGFFAAVVIAVGLITSAWYASHWVVGSWKIESALQNSAVSQLKASPGQGEVINNVPVAPVAPIIKKPEIVIEGIISQGQQSICLIEGEIYQEGDSWKQYEILRITDKTVTMVDTTGQVLKVKT